MAFSNPRNLFYIRLYAIIQIVCGLLIALAITKYGDLNCDRSQNQCHLKSGSLLQTKSEVFEISKFQGAKIETKSTKDRYGQILISERVMLIPNRLLLSKNYSPGKTSQQLVNQINDFVKDPQQQSLQVSQDERWIGFPLGIGLVIGGLLILNRCQTKQKTE
jgi:hypothetical protein